MDKIKIEILKETGIEILSKLKQLEIKNLGPDASINEWVLPVIAKYGKFLLARNETGDIVGICQLLKKWSDADCAFVHSFYIDESYKGRGIGKKFLGRILEILKKEDIKSLELTVSPDNNAALKLYKHYGFKVDSLNKDEYGLGKDRYLMVLKL